jgi:hypothetical protein
MNAEQAMNQAIENAVGLGAELRALADAEAHTLDALIAWREAEIRGHFLNEPWYGHVARLRDSADRVRDLRAGLRPTALPCGHEPEDACEACVPVGGAS